MFYSIHTPTSWSLFHTDIPWCAFKAICGSQKWWERKLMEEMEEKKKKKEKKKEESNIKIYFFI